MKYNKEDQKNKMSTADEALQIKSNDTQVKDNVPAQKDGFRYDYTDNADL